MRELAEDLRFSTDSSLEQKRPKSETDFMPKTEPFPGSAMTRAGTSALARMRFQSQSISNARRERERLLREVARANRRGARAKAEKGVEERQGQ